MAQQLKVENYLKTWEFKQMPWEYKRRILHIINFPKHPDSMPKEKDVK